MSDSEYEFISNHDSILQSKADLNTLFKINYQLVLNELIDKRNRKLKSFKIAPNTIKQNKLKSAFIIWKNKQNLSISDDYCYIGLNKDNTNSSPTLYLMDDKCKLEFLDGFYFYLDKKEMEYYISELQPFGLNIIHKDLT
jgi:hypothetical protein